MIFAIFLVMILGAYSAEIRDQAYPLKCKTNNPEVTCEIYRDK